MSNPQIVSLPAVVQVGSYIINDYLIEITESSDGNGYTMSITRGGQTQEIHLTELTQEYVDECIQTALAEAKASGEFDGVTPVANVVKENGVATITITDAEGTTEAEIFDGVTPVAAVVKNNGVAKVTITDDNGTTEADIYDGVSPKITSSKSNNVAHVSIEDAYGTSEFDIYDGEKGDKGDTGETGNGIADATLNEDYTLTLDYTDGTIFTTPVSIRGERGPQGVQGVQGPRGLQGLRGETGPQGPKGDTGAIPAFTIGTVTTLDPSEDATATISGTDEAPVLNLGIPQGVKGDTGEVSEEEFEAVIAPGFDASTSYAAGSYVLKNGVLYRFTSDHIGAWSDADAEVVTVGGEVESVKGNLSESPIPDKNQGFDIIPNSQVTSSTGAISAASGYSRSDFTYLYNCDYITLEKTGFTNYCFYSSDDQSSYISGSATTSGNIQRPSNANYVIFTCPNANINSAELHLHNANTLVGEIYTELGKRPTIITSFNKSYMDENILLQNVIGVERFPGNLINISDCLDNKYIATNNGTMGNGNNYFCTGFIPITSGTTYKSNVGRNWAYYKSDKTFLSGVSGVGIQNGITAPENAAYIRFTVNKTTDALSSPHGLYFAKTSDYVSGTRIDDLIVTNTLPWCYGKKINWIGDSIVAGADFDEEVCGALGLIKPSDYGINGSTIALYYNGNDSRDAICIRYANMSDDADIIAVSAGTNDWMYAWCPIGTIDSTDNKTFYGAMKNLCEGLINKYPQKVIFFTTPIKRAQAFESGNGGEYTADGVMTTPFSKNKYGLTLGDYADIIKEVCDYYSIPVLDMYRESLLNPHITAQQSLFDSAKTHPTVTGQKIMARRVAGWITQLRYNIT